VTPKDLVVFIEDIASRDARLHYAAALAERWNAYLIATFVAHRLGLDRHDSFAVGNALKSVLDKHYEAVKRAEADARAVFEAILARNGIVGEWRLSQGEVGEALMLHARHASLAVLGPPARSNDAPTTLSVSEDIIFGSGRPSLLVPIGWPAERSCRRVVVGWNGSCEATRAIAGAMPFLTAADHVELLVVPDERTKRFCGPDPGAEMGRHLARHAVPVSLKQIDGEDPAAVLAEEARLLDADLVVIGAYGHAKLRELVFGGVTRSVLSDPQCPVLLAR
jgi:nucleotide-binding universal stress UspA family protein